MKILNVIATVNPRGGGPIEWVRQFAITAGALGHTVEVLTQDHVDDPVIQQFPAKTYGIGTSLGQMYSRNMVPWLKNNAENYDCVIAHGLWRYPSYGTWRALKETNIPYFIYTHGMLGSYFKRNYPFKHLAKSLYWPLTDYLALRDAKAVLFTCEEERKNARSSFSKYIANEIVMIPGQEEPKIDIGHARALFLERFPKLKDKPYLLYLGRLVAVKGCDVLIEAFSKVQHVDPNLQLVLAGPDQDGWQAQLEHLVSQYKLQGRVHFTGMLDNSARWGAIANAQCMVLPSHHENYSFSTVEGLVCGKPSILSKEVGIWRDIISANAGICSDDNSDSFAGALEQWIQLNSIEKNIMSHNARQCFIDKFEQTHSTKRLLNLLSDFSESMVTPDVVNS